MLCSTDEIFSLFQRLIDYIIHVNILVTFSSLMELSTMKVNNKSIEQKKSQINFFSSFRLSLILGDPNSERTSEKKYPAVIS